MGAQPITHQHPSRRFGLLRLVLLVLAGLFPLADAQAMTYQHEIQIDFTFDTTAVTDKTVAGYRLYKDNTQVCDAAAVDPQTFTCIDSGETGTYSFTLTAVYSDGSESPHSAPFPFTFSDGTTTPPPAEETPPPDQPGTGSMAFTFNWELNNSADISGYRFYLNDQKLCETSNPSATSITCYANLINMVMQFSMASMDSLGAESGRSNILTFNPLDHPELFLRKAVTFNWDYTDNTGVSGFKVYHNDNLICETADPATRQLTCNLYLTATNAFKVTAVLDGGVESIASNTIVYAAEASGTGSEEPPSEPNAPLAAVIAASPGLTGQAPFSVAFSGSQSTGPISSYAWDFGDGESAAGATASHTYQSTGSYTATLTVSDAAGTTSQSTANLTITESSQPPPPAQTAPVPVISSSASVGDAPLTVQFDGSGSTSAQLPIVSYAWDFGDGASATGATVGHTYAIVGTFTSELTVTDSAGLTASTSTPVLVTAPPPVENKPPVASFTASTTSGKAPLAVTLDASGSTDEDGTISAYLWNFGDGSAASGVTSQHTFTESGEFTVSLEVTDDKGEKSTSTKLVSVQPADLIRLELQEVQADNTWKKVTFSQPFTDPVIVAGPMGYIDSASASLRVRNVTTTGCEVRVEEWYDIKSPHSSETFNILIIEKGVYTIENGPRLEAGTFDCSTTFQQLTFQQEYSTPPVVLTQVLTENEVATVTGRLQKGTTSSVEYKMQEREKNKQYHLPETVGYIAWEPGSGEHSGMRYEVRHTGQGITSSWSDIAFQNPFNMKPYFLAGMQTYAEADTATVRMLDITAENVRVKIEEEQSKDVETSHAAETVGYIAIAPLK
jgi:PKD repeat protein